MCDASCPSTMAISPQYSTDPPWLTPLLKQIMVLMVSIMGLAVLFGIFIYVKHRILFSEIEVLAQHDTVTEGLSSVPATPEDTIGLAWKVRVRVRVSSPEARSEGCQLPGMV